MNVVTHNGDVKPYVVKLFSSKSLDQYQPVAKEFFGNRLAREFDLYVPDCALIDFTSDFLSSLPPDIREKLDDIAPGLKFGSELADTMTIISPELPPPFLKEYEIGAIFAFDNLVQNLDRGGFRGKPNLLVDDKNILLIDHEQIFPFSNDPDGGDHVALLLDAGSWSKTYATCYKHVFLPHLKGYRKDTLDEAFETFHESLRHLNIRCLEQDAHEMTSYGIPVGNYDLIKSYLSDIKARHNEFIKLLKAIIA